MGCLKLTYREELPQLKVVSNKLKTSTKGCAGLYRYGFNGKESDSEMHGQTGTSYDYGFRMYDTRLARFFSVDPLGRSFPFYSPYQYAGNKPIVAVDLDGLEPVFVHGTWSNTTTWSASFKKSMTDALGYTLDESIDNFNWGGENTRKSRKIAASWLIAIITDPERNPLAHEQHATLIGHSHGGNVNKLVKKKLLAMGWTVDMINIETPQRTDYVSPKGNGVNISFYSEADLVQFFGSFSLFPSGNPNYTLTTTGRKDPNAANIRLFPFTTGTSSKDAWYEKPFIEFGHSIENNIPQWFKDSSGHGLHNSSTTQPQIIKAVRKIFKGRRKKVRSKRAKSSPRFN